MRILLCSNWFQPSIGGVETVSKVLAEEFTRAGASVTVVTSTPGPEAALAYRVVRQPSSADLRALGRQSDLIFQNLLSLRTLLPLLPCRKPVVFTHQSWLRRLDGTRGPENYLKLLLLRTGTNVSISQAIAKDLPVRSTVIPNPFESEEFEHLRTRPRDRDLVFMGRLVSDKGCDLLFQALGLLRGRGLTPSLTIIGDGPEMPALRSLAEDLQIAEQISFLGSVREGRGEIVARHRVMVVPSRWAEPFGVVAVEGIASGCALVASEKGGLMEAVGPCGLSFPNADVSALAEALSKVLTEDSLRCSFVANGPEHLRQFRPAEVAGRYLQLFSKLCGGDA